MDVFSHGLWGGFVFGRKNKLYRYAFVFGILPDLIPFLPYTILSIAKGWFKIGRPTLTVMPAWVFYFYNITHSLVVATLLLLLIWLLRGKRMAIAFFAWPLHILFDIPTHSADYFPTQFLYPFSSFHIDGTNWSHPVIMISNYIILSTIYSVILYTSWKKSEKGVNWKP